MAGLHEGRVIWVTGGAAGIGRATIETVLEEGGRAVASDLPESDFAWTDGEDRIATLRGDVTQPDLNDAAVALALERYGRIDGAALNAGTVAGGNLLDGSLDAFDRVMAVNVRAVVLGIRAAARFMQSGSAISVTASTSGLRGDPGLWAYNTSKAGVINLVRSASMDLASRGIRINAVCPGPTETGMTAAIDPASRDAIRRRIPLQRWGAAGEVAAAHSFLLSQRASFITGAHLAVDGGISANGGQFSPPRFDP
jgi:NAD(P)-dependent dehydrogenase (short-subunit alcohol dehydrogenase family)